MTQDMLRPGGLQLTGEAVRLARLRPGCRVLDVGCGGGATVAWLRRQGFDAAGVDLAVQAGADRHILRADAARLPFEAKAFDAVLFECSLSRMDAPEAVLAEARRVLRRDGVLVVCDLFARGVPCRAGGQLGRLEHRGDILNRIEAAGFAPRACEEHNEAVASYWAQLVFEAGEADAAGRLGLDMERLKAAKCGYFIAVFGGGGAGG